jgi:hypothetical protein
MKFYLATLYVSIEAETEEEARKIAFNLKLTPKEKGDKDKIYWDAENAATVEPYPY